MSSSNPLLENTPLPRFSAIDAAHVGPAVDRLLKDYQAAVDALLASGGPRTWDSVMQPQEEWDERLSRMFAPVSHLHSVKDSPALREAYADAIERITEHETELGQNRALYQAVQAVADSPSYAGLHVAQRAIIDDALRGFRLSGVALEEPERSRFKAIATRLSQLSTEFEQSVRDATEAWTRDFADEKGLEGLPDSGLAVLRQAARDAGVTGYRVTLHQPSYQAVMTYAEDRALRHDVYEAYVTRASDQGPHAGRFDNSARIAEILALRHEAAQLIGFPNAAAESLATKMAPSPEAVLKFLRELAAKAKPVAQREFDELSVFAREKLGLESLQHWDVTYASEKLRLERYALSEEELKPYFPADAALEGLFAVVGRAFRVRFARRDDVDTWHPDVRWYDVLDESGRAFAGVYLDLYARQGKRGGAWMDVCQTRFRHGDTVQQPVAFLTCNFAPPTPEQPSLLTHDDVVTLFHEFGHGLHHLLTEVDWPGAAGIAGVEWDAVELPSQFMENFCWQREALDLFAKHWQTGEKLPAALFDKMNAARFFHAGLFLVRQLEFALFDFRLHLEFDAARGPRTQEILAEVRREVAVVNQPAWNRSGHSFNHIFAGGYSAGYYSYLWAEVLSADAFERFTEAGIFDRAVGEAFRKSVLAVGGSRPALASFVEFRGREPDAAALLRSYGLAA